MSALEFTLIISLLHVARAFPIGLRVVNGTRAEQQEFAFMVSLRNSGSGAHLCGGTILSPLWILTAAHCTEGSTPSSLNIQYGTTKISPTSSNVANVSKIVVYGGYRPWVVLHDIAMLRLQEPLLFNQFTQSVNLPRMYQLTPENSSAVLIGWGLNESRGAVQKYLQKVRLMIYSREECSRRHFLTIHSTNICAGVEGGGRGQCNGDSGGPLLIGNRQVGISSWSVKPCAFAPYPGVYTEVANHIDWINGVMRYW